VFAELLRQRIPISDAQVAALEAHWELLKKWNRALNLTTINMVEEAVERHYCESWFLARVLPARPLRIVDIGSGAGFPGFPVAVFRPDCELTLIESHQRKAVFLKEASRGIANIRVLAKRAQDVKETFDWGVSRAVSYEDLLKLLPRLAPNVALLSGSEVPPAKWALDWQRPALLPWGLQRYLRVGVSRETDR